jgi:hypothetical protein
MYSFSSSRSILRVFISIIVFLEPGTIVKCDALRAHDSHHEDITANHRNNNHHHNNINNNGRSLLSSSHVLRGHGSEVGRQGATKEVEDVEDELIHMRELEGDIEKDLANILESVTRHSITLLHMEEVLSAAAKFKGGTKSNEALQKLASAVEAHPTNLTDLSKSLIDMRRDLALLVRSINASEVFPPFNSPLSLNTLTPFPTSIIPPSICSWVYTHM